MSTFTEIGGLPSGVSEIEAIVLTIRMDNAGFSHANVYYLDCTNTSATWTSVTCSSYNDVINASKFVTNISASGVSSIWYQLSFTFDQPVWSAGFCSANAPSLSFNDQSTYGLLHLYTRTGQNSGVMYICR